MVLHKATIANIIIAAVVMTSVMQSLCAQDLESYYYYHPNGERIEFQKKAGTYAVPAYSIDSLHKNKTFRSQVFSNKGQQVSFKVKKRLGNTQIIETLYPEQALATSQAHLKSALNVTNLLPVLTNQLTQDDIVITNKVLLSLTSPVELEPLLDRYSLTLDRKIIAPGNWYQLSSPSGGSVSSYFSLVRQLTTENGVQWAQPLFNSKPNKSGVYIPNDPLFPLQSNLRNTGQRGSRCDADCDADNAWDIENSNGTGFASGANTVIAIIDDGVQLDHEDLSLWTNPGETGGGKENNGIDDDGNGYIDDWRGWDFVDDDSSATGSCGEDSIRGVDNDPSPQVFTTCVNPNGDDVEQDDHGTAVAGIAAAKGSNNKGVAGVAFSAEILPIRLVSEFDADPNTDFCTRAVEALTYAGMYADVINISWEMQEGTCPALDVVIEKVIDGTLPDIGTNQAKRKAKGTPVVAAAGNKASGWVKVSVPIQKAGEHSYEWRFKRSAFPSFYSDAIDDDKVWIDDIVFPDGSIENFESGLSSFENSCELNTCNQDCDGVTLASCPSWTINTDPNYSITGNSAVLDGTSDSCTYSYLQQTKDGPAGEITFWVWVSTDQQTGSDKFEFLVDGKEVISYGDIAAMVHNSVAYPAKLEKVIAVGASSSGDMSGNTSISLSAEERVSYSQFGVGLDVVAPSSDQHLKILTTDRYGASGAGYNVDKDLGGNTSTAPDPNYTDQFGGTSAAAPLVAGIAATMISADNTIMASSVESILRSTADKIGRRGAAAYDQDSNTRSEFYGYGRVNMFRALKTVRGDTSVEMTSCTPESYNYNRAFDDLLVTRVPQNTQFCPTKAPLVPEDELCFPVRGTNSKVAVICL